MAKVAISTAIKVVKKFCPEFEVEDKGKSLLNKIIAKILFFNRSYSKFWTTLGYTAYAPTASLNDPWAWEIIMHEGRHACDAKKLTRVFFAFLYLFPISLVPFFAILALVHSWFWLIGAAVCLLPLPAPFRAWFEFRAYSISLAIDIWTQDTYIDEARIKWMVDNYYVPHFVGPSYYCMWPFRNWVRSRLIEAGKMAAFSRECILDPYLGEVYRLSKESIKA